MSFFKKIWRIAPHVLMWGALSLVIVLQNDLNDWGFEDYYMVGGYVGAIAAASYINLYLLIPHYLFRKRYMQFVLLFFAVVGVTAGIITLWVSKFDHINSVSRFVVLIINVIFFLLITSGGRLLFEYLEKIVKLKEIENKQLKDELSLLKSQVHPHFLFNTLNNLYGLITNNETQKASETTLKLADLMRYLLESSKAERVSLKKEIQFLEDYLGLEKIRLSSNADVKFETVGANRDVFVHPLLFVPLVENAFKHGLLTDADECFAHFSLAVQGNDLFFEARNSVCESLDTHSRSGTGLENLRKRLQLIYPDTHQLQTEQTNTYFKATLHLQV